ncbi:hypothetical protein [Dyella sp. ASV21]|uniref:hypothetical protein n=1 Tax=Dyella sp. ASV21 TaxID=2795114 RepID=UPI0018EC228B|nr:hypothetical protein [Dyella sp. ASV21]
MAHKETWYCNTCGGLDVRHDAVARYNPETSEFDNIAVLDDTWCEDCMEASSGENVGDPAFGIPGVTNECEDGELT